MDLRQLRFAVALAEELHFGRAAAREPIAQATFSEQIQRLERTLGVRLFARTTRSVRVTPAGAVVLPRIRRVLDAVAELEVEAARAARGDSGRLSIGLAATAIDFTPRLLRAFAVGRPDVRTDVEQFPFLDPSAGLAAGRVDVALVWAPIDGRGLVRRVLRRVPRVAVLPADHPLAGRAEVPIGDLLAEPWCGCPPTDPVWTSFWLADEHRRGGPARIGGVASSLEGTFEIAAAGRGIGLAPAPVRHLAVPGVRFVAVPDVAPCEVSVAWPAGSDNPLVDAFVATATAVAGAAAPALSGPADGPFADSSSIPAPVDDPLPRAAEPRARGTRSEERAWRRWSWCTGRGATGRAGAG